MVARITDKHPKRARRFSRCRYPVFVNARHRLSQFNDVPLAIRAPAHRQVKKGEVFPLKADGEPCDLAS